MVSGVTYTSKSWHPTASVYDYPPSRPMSQLGAAMPYSSSRMSLAPSEMGMGLGRPQSTNNEMEMAELMGNLPSDDALLAEIREILRTADLMTITKKSVKMELERRFGCSLEGKRMYIGSATEAILSGQL